jgi:hypothetical protein
MANTYSWLISQLDCYSNQDGGTDVVMTIHWRRQASNGQLEAYIFGSQIIRFDDKAPFTPYVDLTEAQVIGWLEEALGAETLAAQVAALDQQITNQINPPVVSPPLPWA